MALKYENFFLFSELIPIRVEGAFLFLCCHFSQRQAKFEVVKIHYTGFSYWAWSWDDALSPKRFFVEFLSWAEKSGILIFSLPNFLVFSKMCFQFFLQKTHKFVKVCTEGSWIEPIKPYLGDQKCSTHKMYTLMLLPKDFHLIVWCWAVKFCQLFFAKPSNPPMWRVTYLSDTKRRLDFEFSRHQICEDFFNLMMLLSNRYDLIPRSWKSLEGVYALTVEFDIAKVAIFIKFTVGNYL